MAKIKPEKASEKISTSKFGGIRHSSALTGVCAASMRNFRITADGFLEKRTGTRQLYNLGVPIRGVWQGALEGEDYLMVVAGSTVYIKLPGQSSLSARKQLNSSGGNAAFCFYLGTLYLFDGNEIYRFSTSSKTFFKVYGYSPLYGNDWDPIQMGEVYEPINTLSSKIRIRYDNSSGSTVFNLPFGVAEISRVEVDGVAISPNPYVEGETSFSISQSHAHGTLTAALTLSANYIHRSAIAAFCDALLFADADRTVILLYGGSAGHQLAYSLPVTDSMRAESDNFFSTEEDPLYFPLENRFSLADPAHPIHAVFRDRTRVIAMNDRFAWALEFSGNQLLSYPLEGGGGCSSHGGWALCGDHPVAIQNGVIFQLRFPSGESDQCIPESLTREIIGLLPASIFQNGILAWFPGRNELWLRDPTETDEGLVWVFQMESKEWYCFNNLYITKFFELDGTIGFGTSNGKILLPDETIYTDNGSNIAATYQSHYLAFSTPENNKRAIRTTVCADTGGQQLTVLTQTDNRSQAFQATGQTGNPEFFESDMSIGRFRFARIVFSVTGGYPARIYRLSMLANH